MREMKDSGIEWIGKIPKDWNVKTIDTCFKERNEKVSDYDWEPLSVTKQGIVKQLDTAAKSDAHDARKKVCNGDFVINSRSDRKQSCGLSEYDGSVSLINIVLENKKLQKEYIKYLLKNYGFAEEFYRWGSGIVADLWSTNYQTMKKISIPIPPTDEQFKIGKELDKKIAEIDNVIEKTKQTIDDYKLYKQTIITKAVTKGLDEKVETKDSGIEWIGKIPLTWKVERIKDIASLKTGTTPNTSNQEWFDGDLNWFTPGDFHEDYVMKKSARKLSLKAKEENVATIIPEDTTLIIGIGGTAGKIGYVEEECSCNQQITAIISNKVYNKYIMYWMIANTKFLKETALYTTLPIINNDTLGKYIFLNPKNIDEEIMIVNYLDKKCNELDVLIKSKENLITELENYKKSLIYEYVTGKKEVDEKKIYNTNNISGIKINCKDNIFAQAILLCKIIEKLRNYNLGRVKAEKTLYLIEKEVGFDFNNKYVREAAGPLSENIYKCESIISKKNKWVNIKKVKKHIEYETLPNFHKYSQYYDKYFSSYDNQIENIIDIIRNYSTDKAEMVATLYAAWNDFIIKKDKVSDIEIVKDVRENWNDRKKRFNEKEWLEVLEEMKQNGLTPKGNGNLTIIKE